MQQTHLSVRSWRRLRLLVPVLAVAFALLLVLPAFAAPVRNIREPFSFTVLNPCNGELAPISGELHLVVEITLDGSGGFHAGVHQTIDGSGVGNLGNKYVVHDRYNDTETDKVGHVLNFPQSTLIVSQGAAPNFVGKFIFHFTVNANGTATSFVDHFSATCQG